MSTQEIAIVCIIISAVVSILVSILTNYLIYWFTAKGEFNKIIFNEKISMYKSIFEGLQAIFTKASINADINDIKHDVVNLEIIVRNYLWLINPNVLKALKILSKSIMVDANTTNDIVFTPSYINNYTIIVNLMRKELKINEITNEINSIIDIKNK